jgi:hypothetical protein
LCTGRPQLWRDDHHRDGDASRRQSSCLCSGRPTPDEWMQLIRVFSTIEPSVREMTPAHWRCCGPHPNLANSRFASAAIAVIPPSPSALATPSSPPPARTQIWPTMHLLTLERIGCRITVISWWIVGRSITINDALITRHQFPTARVTKVEAAGRSRLVPGPPMRSTALSQSQPEPKPAAAPQASQPAISGHIRSISVLLKPEIRPRLAFGKRAPSSSLAMEARILAWIREAPGSMTTEI